MKETRHSYEKLLKKEMCNSPQEPSRESVQRRYLIGQANSQLITFSDMAMLIGKEHEKLHMEPRHFVHKLSYQPIELLNKPYPKKYQMPGAAFLYALGVELNLLT